MDTYTITMWVDKPDIDRKAITYALNELGIGVVVSVAKGVQ
jgi:hypothetical protein